MRKLTVLFTLALVVAWALSAMGSQGPQIRFAERPSGQQDHTLLLTTATGCVEVDLELVPGPDPDGLTQTLSTEITNCGDEAALIDVEITLDLNGTLLGPFTHHVYLAAGGSLVRGVTFAVPPVVPTGNYTLCVKAIIDGAEDEDCATLVVESPGAVSVPGDEIATLRFEDAAGPTLSLASANGCVEVDVELIPGPDPLEMTYTLSTELVNCGDEASLVDVEVTLDLNGTPIGPFTHHVYLAAGGSLVRGVTFGVPPVVPAGSYTLCLKATIDESSDEDCATLEVAGGAAVSSISDPTLTTSPNPFNAQTRISYVVDRSAPVRLDIYNMLGQQVITLVDAYSTPGDYSVMWDGRNASGSVVASGTYLYQLTVGEQKIVRQMTLLK